MILDFTKLFDSLIEFPFSSAQLLKYSSINASCLDKTIKIIPTQLLIHHILTIMHKAFNLI